MNAAEWKLWSTKTIADRVELTRKYVEERIVSRPDFPTPYSVDGTGRPRWRADEVIAWFEAWRGALPDRPQTVGNRTAGN